MKTTLKTTVAVMLFVTALAAVIIASPAGLFSINNNSTFDLGTVTIINTAGAETAIDVPGSGTFSVDISGGVASARINNQDISKNGQGTNVTLASGFVVQATLTGNGIVVQDQQIISGDKKPHSH